MYLTIPEKNKATDSQIDLRLETMNYGPLDDMPEPLPAAEPTTTVPTVSRRTGITKYASRWPDLAVLAQVVSGIPWLLADARSA